MAERKNKLHFLIYLAGLSIIGFLSTDMYLPAFDAMRTDLATSKTSIAASLSLFLGGFAIAQLIWGPISDRYGKANAIILGLSVFAAASMGIFFTKNIILILTLRVVQAIGACAATVSWQALVIERYDSSATSKIFATIMPLVALSPAIAPLLGVYILKKYGWRFIFLALVLVAFLLILYTFTMRDGKNREDSGNESVNKTGKSYLSLLKSKRYIGNVMIYAFCSAGFFAWLTGAPFFFKDLGYNETEIGLSFVPQTVAFIVGGYGYRTLSDRIKGSRIMPHLLWIYAACMVALLGITLFTEPTMLTLLIPFCIMALANGACYPIAVNEALNIFPAHSGKASALQNTIQLGSCFVASAVVSLFSHMALLATAIVMVSTVIFIYFGYQLSLTIPKTANI